MNDSVCGRMGREKLDRKTRLSRIQVDWHFRNITDFSVENGLEGINLEGGDEFSGC